MSKILLALVLLVMVQACGTSGERTANRSSRDVLTEEEIATTPAQNAYEAISLRRPQFLQSRGPRSINAAPPGSGYSTEYPVVYLDGMYYGDIPSLNSIVVQQIKEIRYLDHDTAALQFGTGRAGGIILVISRGGMH